MRTGEDLFIKDCTRTKNTKSHFDRILFGDKLIRVSMRIDGQPLVSTGHTLVKSKLSTVRKSAAEATLYISGYAGNLQKKVSFQNNSSAWKIFLNAIF